MSDDVPSSEDEFEGESEHGGGLDPDQFDADELAAADSGDDADIAVGALEAARQMSSKRVGGLPRRQARRRRHRDSTYSGSGADSRDPASIAAVVAHASAALGWSTPLARARVLGQWPELVGPEIASRCTPVSLTESVLRVSAESTSWATQLQLMAPRILAKINAGLPPGTVTKIVFSGPAGPSWRKGPWSMSGGRGVRDTYG